MQVAIITGTKEVQLHVPQEELLHQHALQAALLPLRALRPELRLQHVNQAELHPLQVKRHLHQPDNPVAPVPQHGNQVQTILPSLPNPLLLQEHRAPATAEVQVMVAVEVPEAVAALAAVELPGVAEAVVAEGDNQPFLGERLKTIFHKNPNRLYTQVYPWLQNMLPGIFFWI
jgi:hypothetical protein